MQVLTENWIVAVLALVVAILVAWWLIAANRKTAITREPRPAEDGPARRNQALIDAAPAAALPPATPDGLAGVGAAVAAAADPAQRGDDLKRIKGLGPKVEALLHEMGVTTYAQIAEWTEADVDRIDAALGRFSGRIRRDDWRAQARLLANADLAGYQATFGKL
ncbi:hypothetical protein [Tsuneonella sp. HG222]